MKKECLHNRTEMNCHNDSKDCPLMNLWDEDFACDTREKECKLRERCIDCGAELEIK
jgi:hypothetical protein